MIKFEKILSSASPHCFKFINQFTVKVIGLSVYGVSDYLLSKSDVILAINKFLADIHEFSDKPVPREGLNFKAFKMYDLVPYLYTLINLYISVSSTSYHYHRFLPELKLVRFCHLPFEDEIVEVSKKVDKYLQCALLDDFFGDSRYCCLINGVALSGSSLDELLCSVSLHFPDLVNKYDLHFVSP